MDRRDKKSNHNNVIPFPDLDQRLVEKGLERLQQKKYKEANDLFEQALSNGSENSETYIGLVLSNVEMGRLKEAKSLTEEMLRKSIGEYFQIIDLYLMILVQLHEYDLVVTTLEGLLEEKEVPPEKFENFLKMLHFSRRMVESSDERRTQILTDDQLETDLELQTKQVISDLHLRPSDDLKDQMLTVAQLAHQNIRSFKDEVNHYLTSSEGNPFVKTMLLNILKEQEYNQEVAVKKLSFEGNFVPVEIPDLLVNTLNQDIRTQLEQNLEHENPVLFESTISLVERHFFLLYPFNPDFEANELAAAYHLVADEYYGGDSTTSEMEQLYHSSATEIERCIAFIKELEEISYPII